ncbi:prominin-1-A-like [Elgaria multicarinata webbii]|uniref:prominin-1-A-like n=1 Tax=Elgaria multicarinata webbii TaxID=159646 RepID=UPI002FCD4F4D
MSLPNITQPDYHPLPSPSAGGLQGLFNMVHSFLGVVQPNDFPTDFLTRLINHSAVITNPEVYKEALRYETGFLVCAVIGLLFVIFVPLVGLFFCCCRCCGQCGGSMYQKQTKNMNCKRKALFASLLAVTIILLAGVICAFVSNQRVTQSVDRGFRTLNNTMDNLNVYLNSIPQEINVLVDSISVPLDEANKSLIDIGDNLGEKIKAHLGEQVYRALNSAEQLLRVTSNVEQELYTVNNSASTLQNLQKELDVKLTTVRDNINKTLTDCGSSCGDVSVSNLKPGANLSTVPDVKEALKLINNLKSTDPNATIVKARKTLDDIPQKVSNQTKKVVSDAQGQLQRVKDQTDNIPGTFSILNALGNASQFMNDLTKKANEYEPIVATFDGYRWIIGICLCCLVLLIIVFNMLGLLFGALGLDPKVMPIYRGCASHSGGNFLMTSAGFSFIFGWLLMLLVGLIFFIGGNTYTLVCQPWANGRLLEFLDTPKLFPDLNLTRMLQLNNSNVTLSSLYNNCQSNQPLWSSLHMDDFIHLDKIFNLSEYTGDIDSTLNKINVSVGSTELLNENQKKHMWDLSKEDGPLHLDFAAAQKQLNQNMIKLDLSTLEKQLRDLAQKTPAVRKELEDEANELQQIQTWVNDNFPPKIRTLNSSIQRLQKNLPQIPVLVNSTLLQMEEAQTFMKVQTEEVIKNETSAFVNSVVGFFEKYLDWAKSMITGEVGRCGPAAWVLDSVNTIFCNYLVDSANAFWFSLGWCTVFLLPNIILAVRLAKFYRRMFMDDFYEDDDTEPMELSRQSMFKMPRAELRD